MYRGQDFWLLVKINQQSLLCLFVCLLVIYWIAAIRMGAIYHICLELFWTVFTCNQCLIFAYFSPDSDETAFSVDKAILWIEDFFGLKS